MEEEEEQEQEEETEENEEEVEVSFLAWQCPAHFTCAPTAR